MAQKNYVGEVFGQLMVLEELSPHITPNGSKQRIVKCRCSCGKIFDIRLNSAVKSGMCRACAFKSRRVDITGKRYGKLVVTSMTDDYISPSGNHLAQCNCRCDCGTENYIVTMIALISGRTTSCGCIKNTRGLLKDHPEYMQYYDWDKNIGFDLMTVTTTSPKKVWWKCNTCGESYYSAISSQTNLKKQHGCPYCSGRLPVKGETDLYSQHPELLDEWDYSNNDIQPYEVACFSNRKISWKCKECGHEWKATVANRVNGSGCPKCNIENVNSFCEQAVYYYVRQMFSDAINSDMHLGVELDIYIPSLNVAIEYDGETWHKSKKKTDIDVCKNQLCLDNGIEMIRIREPKLPSIPYCKIFNRTDSTTNASLSIVIKEVLQYLVSTESVMTVDVDKDVATILEQYAVKKYKNSLLACYSEIAAEWHPIKNGKLTPDKVSKSSSHKVWWLGKCGHSWDMSVASRTSSSMRNGVPRKPQGCPYCSGRRHFPVQCIETGAIYKDIKLAMSFANVGTASCIYRACAGKVKTAGGYHWEYVDEEE